MALRRVCDICGEDCPQDAQTPAILPIVGLRGEDGQFLQDRNEPPPDLCGKVKCLSEYWKGYTKRIKEQQKNPTPAPEAPPLEDPDRSAQDDDGVQPLP